MATPMAFVSVAGAAAVTSTFTRRAAVGAWRHPSRARAAAAAATRRRVCSSPTASAGTPVPAVVTQDGGKQPQQPQQQQKKKKQQKQQQPKGQAGEGGGRGGKKGGADDAVVVTPRAEDFSAWYASVITSGDLAENSPVKGCMVIKPHGYAIWELMRDDLDASIKASGAKNAYFPLLIPQSFLSREAAHVDGFAKECAIVTHHRLRAVSGEDGGAATVEVDPDAALEEPLIIRPTSETMIWSMFSKWIQSHRDLPLAINQWANVVRWEMRTRPFLRTTEFLWQEGHTAHSTAAEARARASQMIDVYAETAERLLAIPVTVGAKSPRERFAGAEETLTIEAVMPNGWALQAGTSHYLGTAFADAFDVTYQDEAGERQPVYASSWGVSTRLMGALIMTHSDDTGLALPPAVAPVQVVVVVIATKSPEAAAVVTPFVAEVASRLRAAGVRVEVDERSHLRPGARYYEWERKGVPLRLEVGPRDAAARTVLAARRVGADRTKFGVEVGDAFEASITDELAATQQSMLDDARARTAARIFEVDTYGEMEEALASGDPDRVGLFRVAWKCDEANELAVKEASKATIRCYPRDGQEAAAGRRCFYSGEPATHIALFGRAF